MQPLTREKLEEMRGHVYGAKLWAYIIRSTDPLKQEKISRMRELADELQTIFDEVVEALL